MRRNIFSLVELLVVIVIIGILAGIAIPVASKVRERGKITLAKSEMSAIIMALKRVEADYGRMANVSSGSCTFDGAASAKNSDDCVFFGNEGNEAAYYGLIRELSMPREIAAASKNINRRNIKYLDPKPNYVAGDNSTSWLDPWGKPYIIVINVGTQDKVKIDPSGTQELHGKVFVYSTGPNQTDDKGKNRINSPSTPSVDDICSWEK